MGCRTIFVFGRNAVAFVRMGVLFFPDALSFGWSAVVLCLNDVACAGITLRFREMAVAFCRSALGFVRNGVIFFRNAVCYGGFEEV